MVQMAHIWDGVAFQVVPVEEAVRMEKAGLAQHLDRPFAAHELKFRHELPGYQTRELRADSSPKPAAPAPQPPLEQPPEATGTRDVDWKQHRKDAARHLGIDARKVTKDQVLEYLEGLPPDE